MANSAVLAIGWFIPFLAGMVIGRFWVGLAVWLGLAVLFFGYVEVLILCSHCPHYEGGSTLRCHANWALQDTRLQTSADEAPRAGRVAPVRGTSVS